MTSKKSASRGRRVNLKSVEIETKILVDEATGHLKAGIYDKALILYTKALELSPHDKNALIARSKCHLLLGKPEKALEDAEAALLGKSKDPHNAKALFSKAEALYHLGDFELSLVYYYRGMKIRPEFDQFRLGVQKAKEAIQNILGSTSVPVPKKTSSRAESRGRDDESARPKTCSISTILSSEKSDLKSNVPSKDGSFSMQKTRRPRAATTTKRTNNQELHLLAQLNVDKRYLQNLIKSPDVKAAHQDSAHHIIMHAEEGINFLKSRQEFWRQQQTARHLQSRKK